MTDDRTRPHRTVLTFEYDAERRARIVERSVAREVDEIADDRTRATVDREGTTLAVTVEATDLVRLRAGTNTWLGLVEVAERTAAVGE